MGCVNLSERFFAADRCSRKRLANARLAARLELEPIYQAYRRRGWDESVGSSGTVRSIADVLHELDPAANGISAEGLLQLARRVENYGSLQDLPFESLSGERRSLFGGGLAILLELFDVLGIEHMTVAEGAMREGLLYDMVGRLTDGEDARERTVRAMQGRYHVDMAQSARVEQTAATLLAQVAEPWDLTAPFAAQLLCWAARLHEIGLDVAHAKYHQHGAYLLGNADMPGFPREEQRLLAFLVGNHRRKPNFDGLELLWPDWQERARRLLLLLRLAVLLHRSRAAAALPSVLLEARNDNLTVKFPARWLREHPLTVADLSQEVEHLKARGIRLRVFSTGQSAGSAPASMAPAA
jgi:exopolyphosphatase/guanosine-5'-triphosphate,3'-diphosphate pyrophosphatase